MESSNIAGWAKTWHQILVTLRARTSFVWNSSVILNLHFRSLCVGLQEILHWPALLFSNRQTPVNDVMLLDNLHTWTFSGSISCEKIKLTTASEIGNLVPKSILFQYKLPNLSYKIFHIICIWVVFYRQSRNCDPEMIRSIIDWLFWWPGCLVKICRVDNDMLLL